MGRELENQFSLRKVSVKQGSASCLMDLAHNNLWRLQSTCWGSVASCFVPYSGLEMQVWGLSFCWSPQWWLPRRCAGEVSDLVLSAGFLKTCQTSRGVSVDLTRVLQLIQPHCTSVHMCLDHLWSSFVSARQFVQRLWYKMCAFIWDVFSNSLSLFLPWLDKNCICF